MSGTKRRLYWDTAIYCAWIGEEQAYKNYLAALGARVADCMADNTLIMTSVLKLAEMMECKYTETEFKRFQNSFNSYSHVKLDIDARIAAKAGAIRSYFQSDTPIRKLRTPDAIHLATAIIYGADEFWTFDEGRVKVSGHVGVEGLTIKQPSLD